MAERRSPHGIYYEACADDVLFLEGSPTHLAAREVPDGDQLLAAKYVRGKGMATDATRRGDDSVSECIDRAVECVQNSQHGSLKGTGMFDD